MRETKDNTRHYTCKLCGADVKEPIRSWKKKPQKDKNVCPWCIYQRKAAKLDRKIRLADAQERERRRWFGY